MGAAQSKRELMDGLVLMNLITFFLSTASNFSYILSEWVQKKRIK